MALHLCQQRSRFDRTYSELIKIEEHLYQELILDPIEFILSSIRRVAALHRLITALPQPYIALIQCCYSLMIALHRPVIGLQGVPLEGALIGDPM